MYWISRVLYPNRNTIFVNIDHEQNLKRRTWILFLNGWRWSGRRWYKKKRSMGQWALAKHQFLKIKMLLNTRFISMANMSLYLPKRLLQYRFMHCKSPNIDCLIKELCIDDSRGNPTYTSTKEETPDNHRSLWCSFGISAKDDLPSLYWVPMLYKCPYKLLYNAGSAKCSMKPPSKLLTSILSTVKTGLQIQC